MVLNLKELKPHVVSRDLKSKHAFIFGEPKVGKTSLAAEFPRPIIFGFEIGYNILDDAMAVPILSWVEFKRYLKQLEDPDIMGMYDTIVIDTVSVAYDMCTAYICDREGVDKIGDIPYGQGFGFVDQEFENTFRNITKMFDKDGSVAYGLLFIAHSKTRIDTDGEKSVKHITPDLSDRCAKIINRMVDLSAYIGYGEDGQRYIYTRQTSFENNQQITDIYAGSHYAYLAPKIPLDYTALSNAVKDALDAQASEKNIVHTNEPEKAVVKEAVDFKTVKTHIGKMAKSLSTKDEEEGTSANMDKYRSIVESYLGKGRGVKDCTESQGEILTLIEEDLEKYIKSIGM